jgi:hypothetical protein
MEFLKINPRKLGLGPAKFGSTNAASSFTKNPLDGGDSRNKEKNARSKKTSFDQNFSNLVDGVVERVNGGGGQDFDGEDRLLVVHPLGAGGRELRRELPDIGRRRIQHHRKLEQTGLQASVPVDRDPLKKTVNV